MKLITYRIPTALNYGYEGSIYRDLFDKTYDKVIDLFTTHKVAGLDVCYLPKHWSPILGSVMTKMLDIDPKMRFNKIYEKYGKLTIKFVTSNHGFIIELNDLIYDAQNKVDNLTHGLVNRKVAQHHEENKKWLLKRRIFLTHHE